VGWEGEERLLVLQDVTREGREMDAAIRFEGLGCRIGRGGGQLLRVRREKSREETENQREIDSA
jgi:hypothetical protein